MSYSPKNWLPGEAIIAEDMNNIELGIQEALEKVTILNGSVKYNEQQDLTDEQQRNAIVNIGAIGTQAGLFYTENQKERAREYIGALGESELNSATDALIVEINKIANNISSQYNPPYNKGDYALINGVLKKALRDIAANDIYNAGYWTSVSLTEELGHPVRYDVVQSLTASQATQALKNIGAIGIFSNLGYSDAQKAIARNNIDAANNSDLLLLQQNVTAIQESLLSNTNSIVSLDRRVASLESGDHTDTGGNPPSGDSASNIEVEALKVRISAVESNIASLNARLTTTNNNIDTLSSTVSDIEDTVQSHNDNFEEIDATLEKLEAEMSRKLFENAIICTEHISDIDSIVCFGDSIFYGRMQENGVVTEQGNGTMQQFAALMGLPLTNLAVSGATLSTITATSVVRQVQNWTPLSGKTPIILIDGGTNDQYEAQNLSNLGEYTDGVNGITNTIYGATYAIINNLLTKNIQPWQIVITTPIPKGIQGDDEYVRNMNRQLLAIGHAMYEIGIAMHVNVINGYNSLFKNLTTVYPKRIIMEDDTHPTTIGAMYYAHYLYQQLSGSSGIKSENVYVDNSGTTLANFISQVSDRLSKLERGARLYDDSLDN